MSTKTCKVCEPGVKRPAPFPGPRCATHHRERKNALKKAAHERMTAKVYGLGPGDYDRLYAAQGGVCAICKRATGTGKRKLAVDHDHATGYVRGLLCSVDNKILGHLRDDPELARGVFEYLTNPPAFDVVGKVRPDDRTQEA